MPAEEITAQIEQFETAFDTYNQKVQSNVKEFFEKLNSIWKNNNILKEENASLVSTIKEQSAALLTLKTESETLDKQIADLEHQKENLLTKTADLSRQLEELTNKRKEPEFQLNILSKKLSEVNDRITTRETEKSNLDMRKVENSSISDQKQKEHQDKIGELETKIEDLKRKNFFTSFVIDNSDQDIFEVEILAKIMEEKTCNLNEMKKKLAVTPIMAVRTIKQLAVQGIINLDEDTNEISLP